MLERASVERGGGGEMWHQEGARISNTSLCFIRNVYKERFLVLVKNSKSTRNRIAKSAPMSRKLRNETSQIFKLLLYKTTIVQKCPKY